MAPACETRRPAPASALEMGQRSRVLYMRGSEDDNYIDDNLIESLSKNASPVGLSFEICVSIAGLFVERMCSVAVLFASDRLLLSHASGTAASYILVGCSMIVIVANFQRVRASPIALTDSISLFVLLTQSVRVIKALADAFDPDSLQSLAQWLSVLHLLSHDYGGYRHQPPARRVPVADVHGATGHAAVHGQVPPCDAGGLPQLQEDADRSAHAVGAQGERGHQKASGLTGGILSFNSAMFASALLSGRHTSVWHAFLLISTALHLFVTMPHLTTRLLRSARPKYAILVQWMYAAGTLCLLHWTYAPQAYPVLGLACVCVMAGCLCPALYYIAQYRYKVWPVGDWDCEEVVPASNSS